MIRRNALGCGLIVLLLLPNVSIAQSSATGAASLVDLLDEIREGSKREEALNLRREQEFRATQENQRALLERALMDEEAAQLKAEELEKEFEVNENAIPKLEETLRNRLGTLGELFGVVRQVAGDTRSRVEESIISAQLPGRQEFLSELAQSRQLPSIADLEKLWFTLQEEMAEQGRVVAFPATVITADGGTEQRQVVRIGPFNAVSGGAYLRYLPENGQLAELGRQPASRHLSSIASFETKREGMAGVSIDPSRGTILSMLIQAPSLDERIHQGGAVGYVIIVLGIVGFALAIYRLGMLAMAGSRIRSQLENAAADMGNALGRVMSVYGANRGADTETLELRLDEAILRETAALQRGTTMIKVLSVIAPLLGLLGTVTGMILTFQQITLFGTGDPKLMAGGISQALVTTVLGLVMAIPLTLLHSMIADRSKSLVQILEERSVGLVAEQAEALAARPTGKAA